MGRKAVEGELNVAHDLLRVPSRVVLGRGPGQDGEGIARRDVPVEKETLGGFEGPGSITYATSRGEAMSGGLPVQVRATRCVCVTAAAAAAAHLMSGSLWLLSPSRMV